MTTVKIRHYVVKRGKGFWQPTPKLKALGFSSVPCGIDGPDAWRRIKPVFGDCDPRTATLEDVSAWRKAIEDTVSLREAHRALKIWRAMWKVSAALGYCMRDADPSLGVRNTAAPGRAMSWSEGEVVRLFKRAWRMEYYGLAAVIAIAWDTQLSPGDVRTLRASQLRGAQTGAIFFAERGKTGKPVGGALSYRSLAALRAYLEKLGCELLGDAPIFRTRGRSPDARGGRPWAPQLYRSDILSKDFRAVRAAEFGEADKRQLADLRRSGAIEAIAGDASPAALAHAMGNTLSASNSLFATYVPVNVTSLRSVLTARRKGRVLLRG